MRATLSRKFVLIRRRAQADQVSFDNFHRIARPRPTFSTLPLRTMSFSRSVTRRAKSVRVTGLVSGSNPLSRIASAAISWLGYGQVCHK
jgi:hypothetical protein